MLLFSGGVRYKVLMKHRNFSPTAIIDSALSTTVGPYCAVPYSRSRESSVNFRFISTYRRCDIFVVQFWSFLDGLRLTMKNVRMLRLIVKYKAFVCQGKSSLPLHFFFPLLYSFGTFISFSPFCHTPFSSLFRPACHRLSPSVPLFESKYFRDKQAKYLVTRY